MPSNTAGNNFLKFLSVVLSHWFECFEVFKQIIPLQGDFENAGLGGEGKSHFTRSAVWEGALS
jgi:hypothetical protein